MDAAITLTVVFKGVGMLLAILGALLVANYGFRLYKDGAGSGRDRIAFQMRSLKLTAYSVGSVVMATSFLWLGVGWALSPNLDKRGSDLRISSLTLPELSTSLSSVQPSGLLTNQRVQDDPQALHQLFGSAIAKSTAAGRFAELNGDWATFDPASISVRKAGAAGHYIVMADVKSPGQRTAVLSFEPKVEAGHITFVPSRITKEGARPK
jgi:hypothetical protein